MHPSQHSQSTRQVTAMLALPLLCSLSVQSVSAQTMKVGSSANLKETNWTCVPVPAPGTPIKPSTAPRTNNPTRNVAPAPAPAPKLTPRATASWKVLTGRSIEYLVTLGVVNEGNAPSSAPLTLTLSDVRQGKDFDYTSEYPDVRRSSSASDAPEAALRSDEVGGPPTHSKIPDSVAVISQPVPAGGSAASSPPIKVTLADYRRRPHLIVTLTGPGVTQPQVCRIAFGDRTPGGSMPSPAKE
jgi:hypothetical protein